ncbi:Chromosome partition protein smc [Leucobacter sp. 7(1)]|uniref:AAA family ATPase n=1 Tax=Leucobacter sp. 7(1) TaxID=1255613 RepID=UPI00097F4EAD|nr:AAA family ATPase [Leucobacter sp. 7(1)]SJN13141.1 Chromosome partition protein smc [Leucobacter sp. 7(1)]
MHLKSLTLKGFKSFAQPTTFQFEPGVTAIVGPNGSGKSNVVDALAWVMGEQGAKTLRGGKMEDVIFAGTATRGPLGRAEVRLTIDNSDGALPIEYAEVTISRTLFRNGSSDYAINGDSCRLLDVQELLSDSGLGREMHVIVGQGQLDAVLRATPEDRRGFIEEAAGILKHRRRKERTLRKLDAMETNLTRLNDLAGEIRRQLKPLGRQAEVARAAQSIAAEARDAKARLLADDVFRLRGELDALSRTESEQHSERIVLQEQVEQKQLRIQRLEQEQHSDELDAARRVSIGLESAQSKLRGLYAQTQQRLTFLATQAESTDHVTRLSPAAVDEAAQEAERLAAAVPVAEAVWERAGAGTRAAQRELDAIDEHIAAQSALVSSHDLRLSQLRGQSEAAAQKRVAVGQEITRRELAVEQAQSRLAEARSALAEFETQSEHGDVPEEGLDEAYQTAQDTQAEAERLRDTARDQLHELEQERAGLDARMSALARSLDQRDASGAVLAAGTAGISGRVAEHVRVTEGFEAAIGAALGTFADALLADSAESAAEAVRSARENDLGRLRTVLGAGAGAGAGSGSAGSGGESSDDAGRGLDPAPEIAGLTRAGDAVIAAPDGVRGFLSRSYIAASVDAAIAARSAITERFPHGGYTVVTFEGDVLTAHTLSGGSQQAPSRIELTAELEQAAARRNEVAEAIADLDAELAELRAAAAHAKTAAHESFAELRTADARLAEHAKERNRLVTRAELAGAEAERATQSLAAVAESARETESQAERAAAVLAAAESEPRPILDASQRDLAFGEVEAARAIELEARLALETARERSRVSAAQRDALAEQLASEQRAADEAARRAVLRARQVAQAERVAGLLPAILDACDRSLTEARLVQQRAEQERARHSQELTLLRSEDSTLRQQLQALTERVHGAELQSYERKLHLSALLERSGNELGLVEDVLIAEYGPDQPVPDLSGVGAAAPGAGSASSSSSGAGAGAGAGAGDSVESQFANRLEAELAAELGLTGPGPGPLEDASDPAPDAQAGESDSSRESVPTVPYVRVEQEKRLARAERRLAELGRINPLALEEFAALEQRHAFLSEQLQDLTKTRADLLSIIAELDEKMQGIFGEAFEDTRLAFAEVFPILFPGGSGEIALSNPDDLLNTGIEMVVKPAGKQVERMSLLSGGERSLAAVAWLMAIFQARPSPFYIVDEVEAALDDANLGRLLQVFERLRENSQLIIITHQKRTMEIADALYGVSMRQDGISAVVGQRIQKDDVERASA